ncbi:MAG: Rrf2 family transcriptional regulator [Chloroflexi bacterium]|nr:MAG: Rrf2 family transcriptional regulator [Chloroflexota bacterium]
MMIGTKGDYGVRALIDLAMYGGDGPVQRAEIARRQHVPEAYLDHLLAQLRRAGLIRSTRGPSGGHELARDAKEITLLQVLETLEGSLAPLPCLEDHDGEGTVCAQQWVWREIYDDMRVRLGAVSLQNLADRERERLLQTALSYSI